MDPGGDIGIAGNLEYVGTEMVKISGKENNHEKNTEGNQKEFSVEGRIRSFKNRLVHGTPFRSLLDDLP
ncbi:MAG: hypothetical protein JW950_08355 [Deltaproteobacteria bacterium]|nr:hypothetical protein [Deltaproteobacteria bacterium]